MILSFVVLNGIKNQSRQIWNADESGFLLCPKISRVIAMRNQKHVYSVRSDRNCQITTLAAANALGNAIPPMHNIYPGKRAPRSNLLKGCVDGAHYERSDKGWMTTKLFYGWLANHVSKQLPPEHPVLLLVDGHSTHIDVEVSKFCSQNGILLLLLASTLTSCFAAFGCRIFRLTKEKLAESSVGVSAQEHWCCSKQGHIC